MDRYTERINLIGASQRERQLNRLKQTILIKSPQSLSCKDVKVDGVDRKLTINDTTNTLIKEFETLPNETITVGEYVVWCNKTWLVINADSDDEVYVNGKIQETNYSLKFQHPTTGAILSYPCITSNKTFNEDENEIISLGANKKSILLPMNENTLLLRPDMRFFCDKKTPPVPYKIIGDTDTTSHDGLIEFIVVQDILQDDDRPDLGVCDYKQPIPTPEPVDPTVPTVVVTITNEAMDNEIKLGLTYTFTATFKNELGETVTNAQPKYTIDSTYGGKVILVDNSDGTATVKVDSKATDLFGSQFTLQCMDMYSGFSSSILFTIVSMW